MEAAAAWILGHAWMICSICAHLPMYLAHQHKGTDHVVLSGRQLERPATYPFVSRDQNMALLANESQPLFVRCAGRKAVGR